MGRQRDESIRRLEFPFVTFRPGQLEMVGAVARSIQDSGRIFIQAATGIGKTMAVLFPAVKSIADHASAKVFYLTARTTGRMAAEKALEELRGRGMRLKQLVLTAKNASALTRDPPAVRRSANSPGTLRPAARSPPQHVSRRTPWTRETVAAAARRFQVCPFEFSLISRGGPI
jgi:Rad3-related DNA helicase